MITSLSAEILNKYPGACSRKYGIDALLPKREVKAGYRTNFFFCIFTDRDEVEVYKNAPKKKKKERG